MLSRWFSYSALGQGQFGVHQNVPLFFNVKAFLIEQDERETNFTNQHCFLFSFLILKIESKKNKKTHLHQTINKYQFPF